MVCSARRAVGWMWWASWVLGGVLVGCAWADPVPRETDEVRQADELVREALYGEIYGRAARRNELVAEARQTAPSYAPAKWHAGLVEFRGQWVRADRVPSLLAEDTDYLAYLQRRQGVESTPDAQLALATWCRNRQLKDESRAHLTQVLEQAPDHPEARRRLGFRRVDGIWVHESDIRAASQLDSERRELLDRWTPTIRELQAGLAGRSESEREAALDKIRNVLDPEAIPALEQVLSVHSRQAALAVLDALAAMPGAEPSLSLARHGMMSPWPAVRQAAAEALKTRPLNDYVPMVLDSLRSPIRSQSDFVPGPNGTVLHRIALQREARGHTERVVRDTQIGFSFNRRRRPATPWDAIGAMANFELAAWSMASAQNTQTFQWNQRAGALLAAVSQQEAHGDPQQWWQWWAQETERQAGDQKPTYVSYNRGYQEIQVRGGTGHECLAAGTPVCTAIGQVPIEQVQVGDLVLAQDPDTGELAYKPVLRASVRPPTALVRVWVGQEALVATGGHNFWVSGQGWVKARALKSGMPLHTNLGAVLVRLVEPAGEAETYNLVVVDFPTFFVSPLRILSHDFTEPSPTSAVVPGLVGVTR